MNITIKHKKYKKYYSAIHYKSMTNTGHYPYKFVHFPFTTISGKYRFRHTVCSTQDTYSEQGDASGVPLAKPRRNGYVGRNSHPRRPAAFRPPARNRRELHFRFIAPEAHKTALFALTAG